MQVAADTVVRGAADTGVQGEADAGVHGKRKKQKMFMRNKKWFLAHRARLQVGWAEEGMNIPDDHAQNACYEAVLDQTYTWVSSLIQRGQGC